MPCLIRSTRHASAKRAGWVWTCCATRCENATTFQGFWPTRVGAFALCMLLPAGRFTLPIAFVKCNIIIISTPGNSGRSFPLEPPQSQLSAVPCQGAQALVTWITDEQRGRKPGSTPLLFLVMEAQTGSIKKRWGRQVYVLSRCDGRGQPLIRRR